MSDVKHTPGPWKFHKNRRGFGGVVDMDSGQRHLRRRVASIHVGEKTPPEQILADAMLIAAAPDLLAAAELVMRNAYLDDNVLNRHSHTNVSCEALRQLCAAIAKATSSPAETAT